MKIKKFGVYRNKHQKDVDFYVTNVTDEYVCGYWIHRSTRGIMHREADKLIKSRINLADWKEVING